MCSGYRVFTLGLGLLLVSTAAVVSAVGRATGTKSPPPNIVVILADDMGYGDLACQNPHSQIPTASLDRLASEGIRFVDAHAASAVCTPMGELRGIKRDTWEGGHRVPFLVRWPGQIPAGTVSRQTISLVDLFATIASIAGATPTAGAAEDSLDISAALRNPGLSPQIRRSIVYHGSNGWFTVRRGDWVLCDGHTGENNKNREPEWFRVERHAQAPVAVGELFNLHDDPQQTRNLYATRPDIVAQLRAELDAIKRGPSATAHQN